MGIKTYDKTAIELAAAAEALSNPARVHIITYLKNNTESKVGDIVKELPIAQATVSVHLNKLRKAGIVKRHQEGNCTKYRLDNKKLAQIKGIFEKFIYSISITLK